MKNILKTVLLGAVLVISAVVMTRPASGASTAATLDLAATYQSETIPNVPATIAASTTATNTATVDVSKYEQVFLQITASLAATNVNTAVLTVPVHRSFDGTTFESTAFTTLTLTYSGVNTRTWATNMNKGAAHSLKFNGYGNDATNIVTISAFTISGMSPIRVPYGGTLPTTAAGDR